MWSSDVHRPSLTVVLLASLTLSGQSSITYCPLSKPIPVYNVDETANDAGMITDIADVILCYENHTEHTQLAVTHLGKQSLILGYKLQCNHNLEIN
jgi:hypothetical protein